MTPATGATGKPITLYMGGVPCPSCAADPPWSGLQAHSGMCRPAPVDPEDCPHTVRSFRKGQWTCKRCGAPR